MKEQLQHLKILADRLDIKVRRHSAGPSVYLKGGFAILRFNDADDPDVVYTESLSGAQYEERPDQVGKYAEAFDSLTAEAHTIKEFPSV